MISQYLTSECMWKTSSRTMGDKFHIPVHPCPWLRRLVCACNLLPAILFVIIRSKKCSCIYVSMFVFVIIICNWESHTQCLSCNNFEQGVWRSSNLIYSDVCSVCQNKKTCILPRFPVTFFSATGFTSDRRFSSGTKKIELLRYLLFSVGIRRGGDGSGMVMRCKAAGIPNMI